MWYRKFIYVVVSAVPITPWSGDIQAILVSYLNMKLPTNIIAKQNRDKKYKQSQSEYFVKNKFSTILLRQDYWPSNNSKKYAGM